jgi:hypothetical protein
MAECGTPENPGTFGFTVGRFVVQPCVGFKVAGLEFSVATDPDECDMDVNIGVDVAEGAEEFGRSFADIVTNGVPRPEFAPCSANVIENLGRLYGRVNLTAVATSVQTGFNRIIKRAHAEMRFCDTVTIWSDQARTLEQPLKIDGEILAAGSGILATQNTYGRGTLRIFGTSAGVPVERTLAVEGRTAIPDVASINDLIRIPVPVTAGSNHVTIDLVLFMQAEASAEIRPPGQAASSTVGVDFPNSLVIGNLTGSNGTALPPGIYIHSNTSGTVYANTLPATADLDGDGVPNGVDNCPLVANADQANLDGDGFGDACDRCQDIDADGFGDPGFAGNTCTLDNCPAIANDDQADADEDGIGDVCDSCTDADGDGFGNPGFALNACPLDNCPGAANPTQADADGDSMGDACDSCTDTDGDGCGDPDFPASTCCADGCPADPAKTAPSACGCGVPDVDADGDSVAECIDNCPGMSNADQRDTDEDDIGDACDPCTDRDGDGWGDTFLEPACPLNGRDNCPTVFNPDQTDSDSDLVGDPCDSCSGLGFDFDGDRDIDLRDFAYSQNWVGTGPPRSQDQSTQLSNTSAQDFGYIRIPDSPKLRPQRFTIETWIKPLGPGFGRTSDQYGATIITKIREGVGGTYLMSWLIGWSPNTQKIYLFLTHQYNSSGIILFSNSQIPIGTLAHIAISFDGQMLQLYINGQSDSSASFPYPSVYYSPNEDLLIGAGNSCCGFLRRFQGVIDEVRIWDYARDACEISTTMRCTLTGTEPGLLGYWTFDDGTLSELTDNRFNGIQEGRINFIATQTPLLTCPLGHDNAASLLVTGTLAEQISRISNVPPNDSEAWSSVLCHQDQHSNSAFECDQLGIVATGGQVELIAPPPSVLYNDLASDSEIRAFNERFGVRLPSDLTVDINSAGTYNPDHRPPSPRPKILAGTVVNSHFLHFDSVTEDDENPRRRSGSVAFDTDVLGIIVRTAQLNASDPILGHPGTQYPTDDGRESELYRDMEPYDAVELSDDRKTVTFSARVSDHADQIRVVTQGYDPVGEPYVNSTQYIDCADEVTLNNCDSAWYRFTFDFEPWCFDATESDLSCNVRNARLTGTANVTPQGIAYLNGHRISGLMHNPGCNPDPANGPNDSCYAMQDAARDGVFPTDSKGRRILTAPTPDPFGSDDPDGRHHPEYFMFGENELIFGVVAGANYYRPTGLEFKAEVKYDLLGDCELDGDLDLRDATEFIKAMTGPR